MQRRREGASGPLRSAHVQLFAVRLAQCAEKACRTRFKVPGTEVDGGPARLGVAADAVVMVQAGRLAVFNSSGAVNKSSRHTLDAALPVLARCASRTRFLKHLQWQRMCCELSASGRELSSTSRTLVLRRRAYASLSCRELGVRGQDSAIRTPLLHVNKDNYIVVRLVGDVVAVYRRPVAKASFGEGVDWLRWARPLMLLCMLGFGVWKLVATKSQTALGGGRGAHMRARYAQALLQGQSGAAVAARRPVGRGMSDAQARAFQGRLAAGGRHRIESIPE